MAKIKIVADSSAGLTDAEIAKYNITLIPLSVMIDGTVYVEGETITNEQFPRMMAQARSLPKTSQPSIGRFTEAFDAAGADGNEVLCVCMMASISGTVHAAEQAATISKAKVTVVDSQTTDRAMAFQIVAAAKVIAAGGSMADAIKRMATVRDHTHLYLAIDNLNNLVAGGRISRLAGRISNLLNIKLMLEVRQGQLHVGAKARGRKALHREWDRILADMAAGPKIQEIGISHVEAGAEVARLEEALTDRFPQVPRVVRETVPIIATHTGLGACCLMYYTD